jgi:hypothetical protein
MSNVPDAIGSLVSGTEHMSIDSGIVGLFVKCCKPLLTLGDQVRR